MSLGQLDTNLRRFYAEARNKSGDAYSKSTLFGFRHGIERYLNAPPLNKDLKLTSDPRFKRSNEMLNSTVISLKRQGKENVKHKPAIEKEDLLRIKSSQVLALISPLSLLSVRISSYGCTWEVWRPLKKLELLQAQTRVALGCAWSNSYAFLVLSKLPACIHNSIYAR